MKFKKVKNFKESQFRRITDIKRITFKKVVEIIIEAEKIKRAKGGRP